MPEQNPLPNAAPGSVVLDNATIRGALTAFGVYVPPIANDKNSIRVRDIDLACAEVVVESLLLHDHIYIPKIHNDDYPDVHGIMLHVGGDVVREIVFTGAKLQSIIADAEKDFPIWPQRNESLRKRLREFSGAAVPISYWDRYILSRYNTASAYTAWKRYLHEISDYHITRLDVPRPERIDTAHQKFMNPSP